MYFTKLTLRSVTFVADSPRLSPKHLYKIPDTTPWIVTNSDVQPFYKFKADVLTPAPRDSGPNTRSWLVFEGPIHAESATSPITVHATASNYYHEIPLSYCLPEPQIYGQLLMHNMIDSDTVSAKSNQVMVSMLHPRFKSTYPDACDSAGPDFCLSLFLDSYPKAVLQSPLRSIFLDQWFYHQH
jgi:hypothetical protein